MESIFPESVWATARLPKRTLGTKLTLVGIQKAFAKKIDLPKRSRFLLRSVLQDLYSKDILPSVTYIVGLVSGTAARLIIM